MRTLSRISLILLSFVLCLVIVLRVTAGPANTDEEVIPVAKAVEVEPLILTQTMVRYQAPEIKSAPVIFDEPEVVEEVWPYPITQEEIDLIALVTMAEAEGETELGKRLVIDTILNRMDDPHFPDTVHDVIYYPNAFSVMWNGRIDRCYVMPEIVELVKEELLNRTNYECVFFMAGGYSAYGEPMFQECCHYFSSYD